MILHLQTISGPVQPPGLEPFAIIEEEMPWVCCLRVLLRLLKTPQRVHQAAAKIAPVYAYFLNSARG